MPNPNNVALLTSDGLEEVWLDTCPGCKATVSALKHDFSLCSQLQNALYRIRELEKGLDDLKTKATAKLKSTTASTTTTENK